MACCKGPLLALGTMVVTVIEGTGMARKGGLALEGCPILPTRVDSSLVFAIRQTGNQFVNPIPLNQHESFALLSIQHAGSRFA